MDTTNDYFTRLGLNQTVENTKEIERAYIEKVSEVENDETISLENKDIEVAKLKKSYTILKNTRNREHYLNIINGKDLYIVLDVSMNEDIKKLRRQYNKLIKMHHPDKYGDEYACKRIQNAFDILSNEEKRKKYNKTQIAMFDTLRDEYEHVLSEEDKKKKDEFDSMTNVEKKSLIESKIKNDFNVHNDLIIGRNDDEDGDNLTMDDINKYELLDKQSVADNLAKLMSEREQIDNIVHEKPLDDNDFERKFKDAVANGNAFTIDAIDDDKFGIMEQSELQEFEKTINDRIEIKNEFIFDLYKDIEKERKREEKALKRSLKKRKNEQTKQISDMLDKMLEEDEKVNKETDTGYSAITFDNVEYYGFNPDKKIDQSQFNEQEAIDILHQVEDGDFDF